MGSKRFDRLADFWRHGAHLHLTCTSGPCPHTAIIDSWMACQWARLWRWPTALEADVMRHFVCSKCRARRPRPRPTMNAPTVVDFFPVDERGWAMMQRRIRR